jgi:DNA-directed RNA polymerase specialized sigma24 family protein
VESPAGAETKVGYRVRLGIMRMRTHGHVRALGHDYSMAADLVQITVVGRDIAGYLIG